MAHHKLHLELADSLIADMRSSRDGPEWPVVVDAGYYAVFHAMEALKFVARQFARHDFHRRNRLGIVGGKLWIEHIPVGQHEFGTGEIAHIG